MEWYYVGALLLGGLLTCIALGIPLSFSFLLLSAAGIWLTMGPGQLVVLTQQWYLVATNWAITCLPLFLLMAEVIVISKVGEDAFSCAQAWLGRLPGSLGVATILGAGIFAGVSGSSMATAAAIGRVAIPEMLQRGYDEALATGACVGGGTLGILIPPSTVMVIYCILADQSVGPVFMGGVLPGVLLVLMMAGYVLVRVMLNPTLAPPTPSVPWRERFASLGKVIWLAVLVIFIMGGLYFGIATPTEVAGLGALAAIIVALIKRRLTTANLGVALKRTLETSCFIYLIMAGAATFSFLLSWNMISQNLTQWVLSYDLSGLLIIVMINLVYIVLGCFMDPAGMMVLTMPFFLPLMREFGYDLIWFGVMVTVNMEIANITPPLGFNLFVVKGIVPQVAMGKIIKGSLPFAALECIMIAMLIAFPGIATWLPTQMKG